MIEYPSADDYVKAVQNPQRTFTSDEFKAVRFPAHPLLGIPMPASGSSAVVFKAVVNGEEQALRFFTRRDVSSQERYNALNQYFETGGIADCVATSRWFEDAIMVKGRTWPLVRMQWINGRTLDQYVEGLVEDDDTAGIAKLVTAWRNLLARMQLAEFAHGDLQHGNVLVDASGRLRLVDFDCSWIKPFAGKSPPAESGHRNYQRPGRLWGQWMDTFPGLVIYTSLLALSRNTGLWNAFNDGDNLLFRLEDFDPPHQTDVWKHLSKVGGGELDPIVDRLKECCAPGWAPNAALDALLQPRWWEQTGRPQSPTAPASDEPPWWQLVPGAPTPVLPGQSTRLPLGQPPPAQPLPAPKKNSLSKTPPSIPLPRPASGTPYWPHAPNEATGAIPPPEVKRTVSPPSTPPSPLPTAPSQPAPKRYGWVLVLALIALLIIIVSVIIRAVSPPPSDPVPVPPENPTSPYTAMQLFGFASNNGNCEYLSLSEYRISTYDVEAVFCSSQEYSRFFYKYSGTYPDGWVSVARAQYTSFTRERTDYCHDVYSGTFTDTTGELYNTVFFVYRDAPFVAQVVARASVASVPTLMNDASYYILDPNNSSIPGAPLC